jgi:DNA polymerase-3 subunit beta
MKFTIERDALHAAMSAVHSQTRAKLSTPILQHVLVDAPAGEHVSLTGNCMASCATYRAPAQIDIAGAAALPSDRFDRLVSGLPEGGQVVIESDGKMATIRCGRARYSLPVLPADDFPATLEHKPAATFDLSPAEVARLFRTPAPFSEGNKGARENLRGVCIYSDGEQIIAAATDGQVLIEDAADVAADFASLIVPPDSAAEIAALAKGGDVHFEVSATLIAAEIAARRFVSRLIDAKFPENYRGHIPEATECPLRVNVAQMQGALSRLMTARDPESPPLVALKWKAGEDAFALSLRTGCGAGEEYIDCGERPEDGEIQFQVDNLTRVLAAIPGEFVFLHPRGPRDPMRFDVPGNADLVGLAMPRW